MENKINIRPVLKGIAEDYQISEIEYFQNKTIRPVIKLQHELLISFFKNYAISRKTDVNNLSNEKIVQFIEHSLSRDSRLKYKILGLIIGLFTVEEFNIYTSNTSAFNKRIFGIVKKRLKDSLEELRN